MAVIILSLKVDYAKFRESGNKQLPMQCVRSILQFEGRAYSA